MAQNLPTFQIIGNYATTKTLGSGNFGKAYLCEQRDSDSEKYVLKQIDLKRLNEHDTKGAIMEAELLRKLSSPCIVKYVDSFVSNDNNLSIVMEYCDGGDLASLIDIRRQNKQLFHENEIKNVLCQIAIALSHCHEQNVVHRDIKTDNVFLCKNGRVKLGDFGVSKQIQDSNSMAQTTIGTPYYLSPEMCKGEPYDSKSDIWALGCIVYEMINFQRPFEAPSIARLVMDITSATFEPLSPKYSRTFRALAQSMLSKDPSKRPSALHILQDRSLQEPMKLLSPLMKYQKLSTRAEPTPYDDITKEMMLEMDELESKHMMEFDKLFKKFKQ